MKMYLYLIYSLYFDEKADYNERILMPQRRLTMLILSE